MKIFYITSVLGDSGGSEIYARDIIQELMQRGHEVYIFTHCLKEIPGTEKYWIKRIGPHAIHKFQSFFYWRAALREAKKFKPDIVQSHSNSVMGWLGQIVKKKMKIPHIMLIELISSENKNLHTKLVFQMEKFMLPKLNYDRLIVWTENMKKKFLLKWGIPEEKIIVHPAALNLGNYNLNASGEEINKKYGKHLITCIKTLWHSNAKGLEYIIKAMKYVSEKHPEYKLVIFGNGPYRKSLQKLVKKEMLEKFVSLPGAIKPEECEKVWAATDIAPHSYVYEFSTSISLLEYLAFGKACVVTDVGSVNELVGDAAVVVKAEDEKAIADGIIKLIENPELRKKIGEKARKRVEEKYSIKATVDLLEKTYSEVLNEGEYGNSK